MRRDLGERGVEQREIRQEHRTHQHQHGARKHDPAPATQAHNARFAVLAPDHRVAAPAEYHVLGAQENDGQHQQRQRCGGGELRLWRKLEQAPDFRGHGMEARRHRQDCRRAEQRHRLQERNQRARQHRRQRQRDCDAPCCIPGFAAEDGRRVLKVARRAVKRIGDQHKHIRERVAADDKHQAGEAVDIEQMDVLLSTRNFAVKLIEQSAVGGSQNSQAMAPRNGGVTNEAVTSSRTCGATAYRFGPPASPWARRPRNRSAPKVWRAQTS